MFQISLRAARVNAGLSQKSVAKALKIDVSTVINWERGKTAPKAPQMQELSELYACPIDVIFLRQPSALSDR